MSVAHRQAVGRRRSPAKGARIRQRAAHPRRAKNRGAAPRKRSIKAWLTSLDWTHRYPMSDGRLMLILMAFSVVAMAAALLTAEALAAWASTSGDLIPALLSAVLVSALFAVALVPVRGELRRRRGRRSTAE